jgi:prepilin-type N-terminal cleavage/methylation domain-containing protein
MNKMVTPGRNDRGFTLVELLIVIVVVAILAGIVAVVFGGIINRAHDSVVQSDLKANAKKIELYAVEHGSYPAGALQNGPGGVTFVITKNSHQVATSPENLYYCEGIVGGEQVYRITARSKSGQTYVISPDAGTYKFVGTPNMPCSAYNFDDGQRTYSYGYDSNSQSWFNWVQ